MNKIRPYLSHCTKLTPNRSSPKQETLKKTRKKNIGRPLPDTGVGKGFLNRSPFTLELRSMTDK